MAIHPGLAVEVGQQVEVLGQALTEKRYATAIRVLRNINTLVVRANEVGKDYRQLAREIQYMRGAIPPAEGNSAAEGNRLAPSDPATGGSAFIPAPVDEPKRLSRRTRCSVDLALRLLPPTDR